MKTRDEGFTRKDLRRYHAGLTRGVLLAQQRYSAADRQRFRRWRARELRLIAWAYRALTPRDDHRQLLARALPMLIRLGDFIGNGEIDPDRPGSLGARCDLIGDIKDALEGGK